MKNHLNIIVCIVSIIIEFTNCRPHWIFAIYHDFTVYGPITIRVYFLKTEKHPHFCRHCYPFRTYRTIQIWTANSMILLLLHKLCTQNRRDLILQMYLFYYLAKTAILNTHLHIFHYTIRWTSSLHYIHKLNRLLGQLVNAYTYNSNTYLGMRW